MRLQSLLFLALALTAPGPSAFAAGNVDTSCSVKSQARIDLTRLDGGPPLLIRQDDLIQFYPDRPHRVGAGGVVILSCDRTPGGLGCVVQKETPPDMGFAGKGLAITRLVPRFAGTAVVRVDFTILSPGSCSDPLSKAPTPLLPR